jgi:hypothetical protein
MFLNIVFLFKQQMKVSGFTFVRNAIKYDYPVVESIRSILPLCDEFVVAVGNSEDDTRNLVLSIGDPKIRIIDTIWDESLREGGKVLALETNKAFDAISADSSWAFYLQADEVVHEKYLSEIQAAMKLWESEPKVEGLVFNYVHFWGSYQYIGDSRKWYRREVRVVRNDKHIRSWLDAQGFRKDGRKLFVVPVNAFVYHYGWVKPPSAQQAKQQTFHRYWHTDRWIEKSVPKSETFDYAGIDFLSRFTSPHPRVMQERIDRVTWEFTPDRSRNRPSVKAAILHFIEKKTGWRIGEYRNFNVRGGKK